MRHRSGSGLSLAALALFGLLRAGSTEAQLPPLVSYSDDGSGVDLKYSTYVAPNWATPGSTAVAGPFSGGGWPLHWKVAYNRPDGNQQVVLFLERDLSSRDRVWAAFWDGTTWEDGRGNAGTAEFLNSSLPTNHRLFDGAYEQLSGEFLVAHGTNTDEWVKFYLNDGTTWAIDSANEIFNNVAATAYLFDWIRLAPLPGSNRIAFIGVANGYSSLSPVTPLATAAIQAMVWDGDTNTWIAASKQILSSPITHTQTFLATDAADIDFVLNGTNRGDAVAIWGNGQFVFGNVWNASTNWAANALVAVLGAGNEVRWVRQKASTETDDTVILIGDSNQRIHAVRYDGDSRTFGSVTTLETASFGNADSNRPFDVVWDPRTGPNNVLAVYSDGGGSRSRTSTDGGVTWGVEQTLSATRTYWIQAELDGGNVIHSAVQDETDALKTGVLGSPTPFTVAPTLEADATHNVEPFALTAGTLGGSGDCCSLSVSEGSGTVTVTGAGNFEMTFDTNAGGSIQEFYDLAEDPAKNYDLAGALLATASPRGLHNAGMRVGGTNYNAGTNDVGAELDLLEATPTRVKVRQESFYENNGTGVILGGVKGTADYAIYPSGRLALRWTRETTKVITYETEYQEMMIHETAAAPLDAWATYSETDGTQPNPGTDSFLLAQKEVAGARTDFLHIIHRDWTTANGHTESADLTGWTPVPANERVNLYWVDNTPPPSLPAGASESWDFLTYFKPTTFGDNTDAAVVSRSNDYQTPSTLSTSIGGPWLMSSENTGGGDDFNEAEGAYPLTFDPTNGLVLDIDGSTFTRYSPFFKIRMWRSFQDPTVTLESVPLTNDVDFKADIKPVARAHFAQDIHYHSTLHSSNDFNVTPDVGNPAASTINGGATFVAARYGNGARFTNDGDYLTISPTANFDPGQGAIELWYQPTYDYGSSTDGNDNALFGYWIDASNFFYAYHEPGATSAEGLHFQIRTGANLSRLVLGAGAGFPQRWRANDWVHLRFEWRAASVGTERLAVYVNGQLATPAEFALDYPTPVATEPAFNIGDRAQSDSYNNNAGGIIDEFVIYSTPDAPSLLAVGGLTSNANEYLGSGTNNFTLSFAAVDAFSRGEYLYFGSDSQFRGLNVALATAGQGTAPTIAWEYWNGSTWTTLSLNGDETNNLTNTNGAIYWNGDPFNWSVYSVNGGPDLYYVRAHLASGNYATQFPVEGVVKTDILLFQYCGDITLAAQTFAFAVPAPTSVELTRFDATPGDGAVELAWETSSELNNLGFHVYRAPDASGPYEQVTSRLIPGLGSSPEGARYGYRDTGLVNGVTYYYELEDVETTGATERHGPVSVTPTAGATVNSEGPDSEDEAENATRITYGEPAANAFRIVRRDEGSAVLELVTRGFYAEPLEDGVVRLVVPGFESLDNDLGPAIPVKRTWLDAVAGRKVEIISIRASDVESFTNLLPSKVEHPDVVASADGTVRLRQRGRGAKRQQRGRVMFRGDGLYPETAARIVTVGFQRDVKKALVELAPMRWDGAKGQLLLARRLLVRVSFRGREPSERSTDGTHGRRLSRGRGYERGRVVARLHATESGLYSVRYEDALRGRGGMRTDSLRLSRQGNTVPYHLDPETERFGPGSVLYFLSEGARANPYGHEAVYELELGDEGDTMPTRSAAPTGETQIVYWHRSEWERDRYYQAALLDAPDLWLWDLLSAAELKSYPIDVSSLAKSTLASELTVWLQGASDLPAAPDHHVRVFVNGSLVDDVSWDGKEARRLDIALAPGLLHEGDNLLELENVGDTVASYSMVMLDRYAIRYPRLAHATDGQLEGLWSEAGTAKLSGFAPGAHVLDVSESEPTWLLDTEIGADGTLRFRTESQRNYLAVGPEAVHHPRVTRPMASQLKDTRNRADYLLLAPEAFLQAAAPLLELRQSEGLKTRAVSVEEVYSEFGFGEPTPAAVKDFLTFAYHHWTEPAPRYVLLLGDATYDFKDHLGLGVSNRVPPSIVKTSYLWTASDPSYAAVNGDDLLPDLAIGRLPAASLEEARGMIGKIMAYETGDVTLESAPVVLVADNPDRAGNFPGDANALADSVLASRNPAKVFLNELGTAATRDAIIESFNEGTSLISYIGHGGIHLWADENVFNTADIASLNPQPQQPLLLTMNCLNGYFHFPFFDSLAEALVKANHKGAIAAFSPSGLSLNGPANLFQKALLEELLHGGHSRLGDAVMAAQDSYADTGAFPELLSIYHLLGDPALNLR